MEEKKIFIIKKIEKIRWRNNYQLILFKRMSNYIVKILKENNNKCINKIKS